MKRIEMIIVIRERRIVVCVPVNLRIDQLITIDLRMVEYMPKETIRLALQERGKETIGSGLPDSFDRQPQTENKQKTSHEIK